jgi:hypothetical protein
LRDLQARPHAPPDRHADGTFTPLQENILSKAFSLIAHEISHFEGIDGTEDLAYGAMQSWLLAPSDVVRNADNYGVFVQPQPTA